MRPRLVPELICTDLDKSLAFYVGVLGFSVLYARPEDLFAYLDRSGAELMLEQFEPSARMLARAPLEPPFGRGMNLQIDVDDVDTIHAAVVSAGLDPFLPLEERWYRRDGAEIGVRQFIAQDPDGYLIRLSQRLGTRPIRV
jgi:catechol 2,3-dioxygenase-like lactoylglutathione lyase family enzyme